MTTTALLTLLTDWPNGAAAKFWSQHALLSGALTSLLLVGAGLLVLDTKAQRSAELRNQRVRELVLDHLEQRFPSPGSALSGLRSLGRKHYPIYLVDGDYLSWRDNMERGLAAYSEALGDAIEVLFALPDDACLGQAESMLKAKVAAERLAATHLLDINFRYHHRQFLDACTAYQEHLTIEVIMERVSLASRKAQRRERRVNRVRAMLGKPAIGISAVTGRGVHLESLWQGTLIRLRNWRALASRRLEVWQVALRESDYLRTPLEAEAAVPQAHMEPEERVTDLMGDVGSGSHLEYRALGLEAVLELIDYTMEVLEWTNDDVNLVAIPLGLAESLPVNAESLEVPRAQAVGHGIFEMADMSLSEWQRDRSLRDRRGRNSRVSSAAVT